MSADPFTLKQGDTLSVLRRTLQNADGTPINLTSASAVRFHMTKADTGELLVDAAASVIPPATAGIVEYSWATADTDVAGLFQGEFEVTFLSGAVITVPNNTHIPVRIVQQIA